MKKKIFLSVIAAVLLFTNISIVSASTEQLTDEELQNVYIIGTHAFTENGPKLDTPTIMLASKTIEGDSLEDMVIYFKQAGSDKWVDVAHNYATVDAPESLDEWLTYIDLVPQVVPQDLSETMATQAATFKETYYNKYEKQTLDSVKDSVFYVNLGEYVGTENPTSLTIEDKTYGTDVKSISIGNYSYIKVPVWKISDDGELLVALPWLSVDSLPTGYTTITVGGVEYNVKTYDDVSANTLAISEVSGVYDEGYTNEATFEGTTVNYVTGHAAQALGITLSLGDEKITDPTQLIFRQDSDGNLGLTTPEKGCSYVLYTFAYSEESFKSVNEKTLNYKLALPGKGVIELTINAKTSVGTTTVDSADELTASLAKEDITTITLGKDLELTDALTIADGKTVTIDLNGNTLSSTLTGDYVLVSSGTLTISNGTLSGENVLSVTGGTATLTDVDISSTYRAVTVENAEVTINGGKINTTNGTAIMGSTAAILTLNDVEVEGSEMAISGNATEPLTKVSVINSTLTSEGEPAIYFPGTSEGGTIPELYISKSTLTGLSGIDARSGKITIEDSTITATGTESNRNYVKNHDGDSGTTDGAAALWLHSSSPYDVDGSLIVNISNTTLTNSNNVDGVIRVYEHASAGVTSIVVNTDQEYTVSNELIENGSVTFTQTVTSTEVETD